MNQKVYTALIRTIRTFFAAMVAYLLASGFDFAHVQNWSSVEKVLVAASVAGVTAVLNLTSAQSPAPPTNPPTIPPTPVTPSV